ncbi:MAG: transmembrane anchor protein [Gammaproteobacteria bacterium 28-57-27]|nr:MAG: transmembrane anchor protein [Gammaproteobacteria bacterium 28-57-27]
MYNTNFPSRAELPSAGKLLFSTVIAALIAIILLVTTILPAERGIDPTGIGRVLGLTKMGEIKVSLAAEANVKATMPIENAGVAQVIRPVTQAAFDAPAKTKGAQQHTMTLVLKPDQGAEIKLSMRKDARVRYEWTSAGGLVNFDTHGDPVSAPQGFYHGYGKGRGATNDTGAIVAAFDGKHGWFWRNRSSSEITITLKTSGDYEQIKRVS